MHEVREHFQRQLKRIHELKPYVEFPVIGGEPLKFIDKKSMKCLLRHAEDGTLPPTWGARIYEEFIYPPRDGGGDQESHPFRLFLEISRGNLTVTWPIHDMERDLWLGPTFKAKPFRIQLSTLLRRRLRTFLVYGDKLSERALHRWITVLLAQRALLTQEEEDAAVSDFFLGRSNDLSVAHLRTYRHLKSEFVQPIGGWPSLPALYNATLRWRKFESREQGADLQMRIRRSPNGEYREDDPVEAIEDASTRSPEKYLQQVENQESEQQDKRVPDQYLKLKILRFREPNLYRALLDRIKRGRVQVHERNCERCVLTQDADAVEEERTANALARTPGRFRERQAAWIDRLSARAEKRASAKRKVKRWCSDPTLSEQDIEASVAKGYLVRIGALSAQ
jgi:hypothetical protein